MLLAVLLVSSGFRFRWLGDFYSGEVYATIFFFIHILRKNPIRPTENTEADQDWVFAVVWLYLDF
jgi:hypothetical protein